MAAAAPAADNAAGWSDLPLDLLRDISHRLHVFTDYIRFHAVCTPWRVALPPPPRRPAFLPLLLAPADAAGHQTARCIFSPKSGRHRFAGVQVPVRDRRWVISAAAADAGAAATTTLWLLAASSESSSLINPLTGSSAAAALPPLPDGIMSWARRGAAAGVVSGDGTVFLYGLAPERLQYHMPVYAAVLHPGGAAWASVQTNYFLPTNDRDLEKYAVTYRDGRIIVWHNHFGSWSILRTQYSGGMPYEHNKIFQCTYTVESRGELLAVCVHVYTDSVYWNYGRAGDIDAFASALSLSVYTMEKGEGGNKLNWVRKDSQSLADRVFFLGRPSSFAMDAAELGMSGGCAYLVDRRSLYGGTWSKSAQERCRVFRHSFGDDTSELVEQLPAKWICKSAMWFTPQPDIATMEEIRERLEARNRKAVNKPAQQFGSDFRVYVGNLSRKVDSYQLRRFFSKHGKVTDARVMHDKRTGHSRGFGFATMAVTVDDEPAAAVEKLNGQSLDGRPLRVKFADQEL